MSPIIDEYGIGFVCFQLDNDHPEAGLLRPAVAKLIIDVRRTWIFACPNN
jgi:hypothetical protein